MPRKAAPRATKICVGCGEPFLERSLSAKNMYCSRACKDRTDRERSHRRVIELATRDTDDCVEWPYCRDWDGYGRASAHGKNMPAHRAAYVLLRGPIEDSEVVRHRCDNPPCVNIRHLERGTPKDNHHDCIRRGRKYVARGNELPQAVLTPDLVRTIRASDAPTMALAAELGIKPDIIYRVRQGRTWSHIQ